MYKKINSVYFSATNNTKNLVSRISNDLSSSLNIMDIKSHDFTLPNARKKKLEFCKEDLIVIGVPVYAGRVPNLLIEYLKSIEGGGATCIPLVTFGNRDFDDALIELASIMEDCGFIVISAGAFVYPHSFSNILASNRPDIIDTLCMSELVKHSVDRIEEMYKVSSESYRKDIYNDKKLFDIYSIKGEKPYRNYYKPLDKMGNEFEFRKIKPYTFKECIKCSICVDLCPMGSIEKENPRMVSGKCIKCCACIKSCPIKVKEFTDENYIKHKHELEELRDVRQNSYISY